MHLNTVHDMHVSTEMTKCILVIYTIIYIYHIYHKCLSILHYTYTRCNYLLNLYTNNAQQWTYYNRIHASKIIEQICNMWEFCHFCLFFLNHNFNEKQKQLSLSNYVLFLIVSCVLFVVWNFLFFFFYIW